MIFDVLNAHCRFVRDHGWIRRVPLTDLAPALNGQSSVVPQSTDATPIWNIPQISVSTQDVGLIDEINVSLGSVLSLVDLDVALWPFSEVLLWSDVVQ